jgi:hypothetical protein
VAEQAEKIGALKERAVDMLASLIDSATQAGDFIKDQIPLVIQELLAYHTALYVLGIVSGIGALVGIVFWVRFCMRRHAKDPHWSSWDMAGVFPSFLFGGPALIVLAMSVTSLLKITLAPRVWLIEYAAGLVR